MPSHIVSWGDYLSPALSSGTSIVSFDSILPDTKANSSATATESPNAAESQAKAGINFVEVEMAESRAPVNAYQGGDHSFPQHEKYFFKDGNITFLVDGTLYCIHRYFFSRDSEYFSTRLSQFNIIDHEALSTIISLGDIERKDFEAFLSVIYPENFEKHELSYKEWLSVLKLSTLWGFGSLRKLAVASIKPPTSHDQLLLARTYSIDHWVVPALSALCERVAPLSLDEARVMKIEDVIIVATVRENIRDQAVRVEAAEIARRVEAAQAGKLSSAGVVDVSPTKPGTFHFGRDNGPSAHLQNLLLKDSTNLKSEVGETGETIDATASSATGTEGRTPPVCLELATKKEHDTNSSTEEDTAWGLGVQATKKPCVAPDISTLLAETLAAAKERKTEAPLAQDGPAGRTEDNEKEIRSAIRLALRARAMKGKKGKKI